MEIESKTGSVDTEELIGTKRPADTKEQTNVEESVDIEKPVGIEDLLVICHKYHY